MTKPTVPAVCENPECQRPFEAYLTKGKLTRFCCNACYHAARTGLIAVCENPECRREYAARKRSRYCSRTCFGTCKRGENHPNYQTEPSYWTKHSRVRHYRGPAKDYPCVDCDGPAYDWSLIHGRDGKDPADFEPRCRKCHLVYDGHPRVRIQVDQSAG